MLNTDEDALICDLMEVYGIPEMRRLPPSKVSVFSCGLKDNSRIQLALSGARIDIDRMLLAACVDYLALIAWSRTADAEKNQNRPQSVYDLLVGRTEETKVTGFDSAEEFEEYRRQIIERIKRCQQ